MGGEDALVPLSTNRLRTESGAGNQPQSLVGTVRKPSAPIDVYRWPQLDRTGPRPLVRRSRLSGQLLPSRSTSQPPGHDLRFGVGVQETTFRVNVRWVTPLGEETASMS